VRSLTHPATVAFGLANLYLLDLTGPLISSQHDLVYHLIGSASSIIIPIIVYVVALWILVAGLLFLAEKPGPLRVIIWSGLLLALPSILLHAVAQFSDTDVPDWVTFTVAPLCLAGWIVISIFWKRFLSRLEVIQPAAAKILGFFAFTGVLIFAQLIWNDWQARNLNPAPTLHHAQVTQASPHPRIIWIVLDELSHQQVYERRFPSLELPAFDQLAAQSTVFTQVIPTGEYTRYILPSLFTGVPSDAVNVSAHGMLLGLRNSSTGKWTDFEQHQTVFQDALDAGYSTGVAGWYNPYCRIMPEVFDHCFWTYRQSTPANLSPNRSLAANLVRPFRYLIRNVKHLFGRSRSRGIPAEELRDLRQHATDYHELLAAGDAYLADPSIDFLLLHMPVPHPYGFYDRTQKSFATRHTSYIDNLALADLYLAHVRQILEQQNEWNSATVIVMGDHSWRTRLWIDSMTWTDEDQAASKGGEFDDRPAYIVKLPNQQMPARIDESFSAIRTRALLDALLRDQFRTPTDLQSWAGQKK
jgi:hypothetical protein